MAIYRTVAMAFWTDSKVVDDFTPEDKFFYLYLFTNPHTNLAGCYEISIKQAVMETGYSKDTVENLISRFERVHDVLRYSPKTKEILLLKWFKYNWTASEKFRKPLLVELKAIKEPSFKEYLMAIYNGDEDVRYGIDTKCIGTNCSGTSVTVTVTDTDTDTVSDTVSDTVTDTVRKQRKSTSNKLDTKVKDISREVVEYLNSVAGTKYEPDSKATVCKIKKRVDEGRTVDDFKKVIDNKAAEWLGDPKMRGYLRPNTLFCDEHFEEYLNQGCAAAAVFQNSKKLQGTVFDEWRNA